HGVANAAVKDGFYLTPNASVIFVDKAFTKDVTSVGVGGGGGLALGYQVKNFLIDLNAEYQYYGGKGTVNQTTSGYGTAWLAAAGAFKQTLASGGNPAAAITAATAAFANPAAGAAAGLTPGTAVATTTDSQEGFVPVTLGLKYLIPVMAGGKLSITPGVAGGAWIHTVKRDITTTIGTGATAFTTATTDNATEIKGVVVPSIALDYAPLQNLTISLTGKFYIVPGGYSDAYTSDAQAAATASVSDVKAFDPAVLASGNLPLGLTPAYAETNQNFWYGGVNLGVQYTF
ncbi:MAG: hypothetical protein QM529_04215, partial [Hydrotalea sp.]|nr:hypothetical protein [Hydrotalea sp.]